MHVLLTQRWAGATAVNGRSNTVTATGWACSLIGMH